MGAQDPSLSGLEARQELYAIMHEDLQTEQAFNRVLEIGTQYLGISHGHITDIDERDSRWEVIGSTDSPDGPYPEGMTADLGDSYCRRTMQQPDPLALHDAGNQGWSDDHAYNLHQLDTYLGIRLTVFGRPYGTLCFVDPAARPEPFSEAEHFFIELAGHVLGQVIQRNHKNRELANRDRVIGVLNRVLRHNLRNELNVVQGYAQLLQQRTLGEEARYAHTIEEATTDLLDLAETARELEELTRTVPVPRPTNIVPLIDEAVADLRREYPGIEVSYDAPAEVVALSAPAFVDAVFEVLENAAEHGDESPEVTVDITHDHGDAMVEIEDDGPGLPPAERRLLMGETETPLEHGSGLGLFLVYWILTHLDGAIDVTVSPEGTMVELRLPRPSATDSMASTSS